MNRVSEVEAAILFTVETTFRVDRQLSDFVAASVALSVTVGNNVRPLVLPLSLSLFILYLLFHEIIQVAWRFTIWDT